MIFVGALAKLLASGRIAAAGASLGGFALVLYGLTTLQQGMGGLAEQLHPADLPSVLGAHGTSFLSGLVGLVSLVVVGLVTTAVMQSSTAAIAVTLSAFFAGAVGLEQGCALIIGQNIGTATSSALAAIGASTTAKRLAVAYILFKLIAALIALVLFPLTIPLLVRAAGAIDGVTLLAAYHTAYNVVGVAALMPAFDWFARVVERLLPERGSPLTRSLDRAALVNPIVAVDAVRRTVALTLQALCEATISSLDRTKEAKSRPSISAAADALQQTQEFQSEVSGPPASKEEELRLTSTVHALDHASRFAEIAREELTIAVTKGASEDVQAVQLFEGTLGSAARRRAMLPRRRLSATQPNPSSCWTRRARARLSPKPSSAHKSCAIFAGPTEARR
jgi:phosphate:Na+ symporter